MTAAVTEAAEAAGPSFVNEAILAPIAGANPAGADLSYDPTFEQLAAEIEKVTSVAGELPDWGMVRRESARILREGSKDLRAASWWVASAGILEGWPAIAEAAATYQALVERFWNEMYPPIKRLRARAGLVTWLWEQLAKSLPAKNVTIADGDAVRAFDVAVTAIDGAFAEKVGDANPGLGALRGVVRDKLRSIPEPPKAADPFAAPAPGATPAAQASPSPAASSSGSSAAMPAIAAPAAVAVASLDAAEAAADGWKGPIATLAYHARGASPTAPWPYRLARIAAWLTLEIAPVAEGGKTFVRGPKNADRSDFQAMFDGGSWEGLRNASEETLAEHALWLDLNRWSAIALERLGPPFAAAREAVGRETAALIARIPALPSLAFSNGTAFASPETVDWLAAEQARFGGGGGGRAASPADEAPKALLADAEARVAAGQVDEGLAVAISLANNAASAAVRFRAQLLAAQMAQRAAKGPLAIALLDRLLSQVDPTLEAWEPDVCASVFETALKVYRAEFPDAAEKHALLFRRLLQVDPAAALRIG